MPETTLEVTGLYEVLGRDDGIEEPYWEASGYVQKTLYWLSGIKGPWSYSLIKKKYLNLLILEKK